MQHESQRLEVRMENCLWVAHQLFDRKMVTGSTGNISFMHEGAIYISESGSVFGRMNESSFAIVALTGEVILGKPSKEYPIHLELYKKDVKTRCVIHTHSLNSTVLSCLNDTNEYIDRLLTTTPYLSLLTAGKIGVVPYHPPGSIELFNSFSMNSKTDTHAYLMKNHGIIVSSDDIFKAFGLIEEFEISSEIVLALHRYDASEVDRI